MLGAVASSVGDERRRRSRTERGRELRGGTPAIEDSKLASSSEPAGSPENRREDCGDTRHDESRDPARSIERDRDGANRGSDRDHAGGRDDARRAPTRTRGARVGRERSPHSRRSAPQRRSRPVSCAGSVARAVRELGQHMFGVELDEPGLVGPDLGDVQLVVAGFRVATDSGEVIARVAPARRVSDRVLFPNGCDGSFEMRGRREVLTQLAGQARRRPAFVREVFAFLSAVRPRDLEFASLGP